MYCTALLKKGRQGDKGKVINLSVRGIGYFRTSFQPAHGKDMLRKMTNKSLKLLQNLPFFLIKATELHIQKRVQKFPGNLTLYLTGFTSRDIFYQEVLILSLDLRTNSNYLVSGLDMIAVIVAHINILSSCICEELIFSNCFTIINKLFLTIILKSRAGFFSNVTVKRKGM